MPFASRSTTAGMPDRSNARSKGVLLREPCIAPVAPIHAHHKAPWVFPYTAPNAAAGEIAIAVQARGPFVSLVGTAEVSAAALERACRWLEKGDADRVIVVAVECPSPSVQLVCPAGTSPIECAAAVVLEPLSAQGSASVQVRWAGSDGGDRFVVRGLTLLSVEALARVALAHRALAPLGLRVDAPGGACLWIDVIGG